MKEIKAYFRPEFTDLVVEALEHAGARDLTVIRVDAFVKLHEGERKIPICCPLCFETYQKDPKPYLERWAQQTFDQELRKVIRPTQES